MSSHVCSKLSSATIPLSDALKRKPRPRSYGVHNSGPKRLSAACLDGNHTACFSLKCNCGCGHR